MHLRRGCRRPGPRRRAVLPQELPSGAETPPVLPLLRSALDGGAVGVEQTRAVVSTMGALPVKVDPDLRAAAEQVLVEQAQLTEPRVFAESPGRPRCAATPTAPWTDETPSTRSNSPWAPAARSPG